YWRAGSFTGTMPDGTPATVSKSPIVVLLKATAATNGSIFKCPADKSIDYKTAQANSGANVYWYSYTMNGIGPTTATSPAGWKADDHGMGSTSTAGSSPFKSDRIRTPVNKIMLVEEPAIPNGTSGSDAPSTANTTFTDDGRWEAFHQSGGSMTVNNTLTTRHRGRGDVNYADGHVDAVFFGVATNQNNVDAV